MPSTSITSRLELEAAIQEKAATDTAFRTALLANPAAALEQAFGLAVEPGISIRIIEEKPGEVSLVLPAPADELSGKELEEVAGGFGTPVNAQVTDSVTQANVKMPDGRFPNLFGWPFNPFVGGHFPFRPL